MRPAAGLIHSLVVGHAELSREDLPTHIVLEVFSFVSSCRIGLGFRLRTVNLFSANTPSPIFCAPSSPRLCVQGPQNCLGLPWGAHWHWPAKKESLSLALWPVSSPPPLACSC